MNKQAILKTAICYWSKEDECYLMQSPLCESVLGVGDTAEEAQKTFGNLLNDAYEAYLEGRVPGYGSPGRPAKGGISLDTNVQPPTKNSLKQTADSIGCSMGEVVDYLVFWHNHQEFMPKKYPGYDHFTVNEGGQTTTYKSKRVFNDEQVEFIDAMIRRELRNSSEKMQQEKNQKRRGAKKKLAG